MFKSRRVKRLLGNRIGDDRPRLISRDKFHREFDRADRQRRVERVGFARKTIDSPPERNDGQRPRENLDGAGRSRRLHADIEPKRFRNASEQRGIADDEKRRQISGFASAKSLEGDFRPNAGRVALRQGEGEKAALVHKCMGASFVSRRTVAPAEGESKPSEDV